eukprot:3466096-Ditylum_brightwellii.AAC.1
MNMLLAFQLYSRLKPTARVTEKSITLQGNVCTDKRQARLDCCEKDKNDNLDFVKSIIKLHQEYLVVIPEKFSNQHIFSNALIIFFKKVVKQ